MSLSGLTLQLIFSLAVYGCLTYSNNSSATDTVRFVASNPEQSDNQTFDPQRQYYINLLRLALDKSTDEFGEYQLEPISAPMWQQRQLKSLKLGIIDVVWTMTTQEREQNYHPVRIPLMRGLIGFRVPLILKDSQAVFNDIATTSQLKKKMALQGHDWPDTQILQKNGFRVQPTSSYDNFFALLKRPDVHYIPRGVIEAVYEIGGLDRNMYELEQNHLLVYPAATYFFTSKENTKLAKRIELGLTIAQQDGSFDRLFFNSARHADMLESLTISNRTVHCLENPLLPKNFPFENTSLWMASIDDTYSVCEFAPQ